MKIKTLILSLIFALPLVCAAQTNVLELTWLQPPGYASTLYSSTNLSGTWMPVSTNPPPVNVYADQPAAFFYVVVAPTNSIRLNYAGSDNPFPISAPAGATFVGTNSPGSFWFKISDDSTNGWVQGI